MNFLKKIGAGIIKYLPLALGIGQMVSTVKPEVAPAVDKLEQIQTLSMVLEKAFAASGQQQSGPQKLLALVSFTTDILKQSELVVQHGIGDEALFGKGANEIAQGVVDVLQSLKGKDGSTVVGTSTLTNSVQPVKA